MRPITKKEEGLEEERKGAATKKRPIQDPLRPDKKAPSRGKNREEEEKEKGKREDSIHLDPRETKICKKDWYKRVGGGAGEENGRIFHAMRLLSC